MLLPSPLVVPRWRWSLIASACCLGCPAEPEPALHPARWQTAYEAGTDEGTFLSAWGPSEADVWAVGGQVVQIGDVGTGLVHRREGDLWSRVELPLGAPLLNWVHGIDTEVWIVGNAGAALHHDVDGWVATVTGLDVPLWGCWVTGRDDVWAVGGDALDDEGSPVIVHWDGEAWAPQVLPTLDRPAAAMFKVWAAASNDVWVVGDAGVILHYDGRAWVQVPSGTGNDLISLWGRSADDIVAVGGRSNGTLARWDGTRWTTQDVGEVAGLNGVWMHSSGDAAVAGNAGGAGVLRSPGFELELEPNDATQLVLHGVFGFESGARIAVGGSLDRSPPYVGVIMETD